MKMTHRLLLVVLLVSFSSALLPADTVELKNGEVIQGHFLSADREYVRIKVGEVVRTFRTDKVNIIRFALANGSSPRNTMARNAGVPERKPTPPVVGGNPPAAPVPDNPPSPVPAPVPPAPPRPESVTLPAGSYLAVRMIDAIDTEKNQIGDHFTASTDDPTIINGETIIPKNTIVHGRIIQSKESGKIQGAPELRLELTDMILDGRQIQLRTGDYSQVGQGRGERSAEVIGGGAALGAIIGAIAGKGKGVAIGAASGAAAGTAVQVLTKGNQLKIPSETRLSFRLEQDVRIRLNE